MYVITGFFYDKTSENIGYCGSCIDKEKKNCDNLRDPQCIKNPAERLHFKNSINPWKYIGWRKKSTQTFNLSLPRVD